MSERIPNTPEHQDTAEYMNKTVNSRVESGKSPTWQEAANNMQNDGFFNALHDGQDQATYNRDSQKIREGGTTGKIPNTPQYRSVADSMKRMVDSEVDRGKASSHQEAADNLRRTFEGQHLLAEDKRNTPDNIVMARADAVQRLKDKYPDVVNQHEEFQKEFEHLFTINSVDELNHLYEEYYI